MATIEDPAKNGAGNSADRVAFVASDEVDEDGQDDFKPLTREEAQRWRQTQPRTSVWAVLGWQVLLALLAACVAAVLTRSLPVVVSLLYGAAAVVLPTGLMAWGLTKGVLARRAAGGAQASLAGFFVWEGAKLLLAIALLALAPRLVPDLSWLALVAGLVVVLKAYWLELWFRARRFKQNSELG